MITISGMRVTGTHVNSPVKLKDVITGIERWGTQAKVANASDFRKIKLSTYNNLKGWPKKISLVRGNTSMSVEVTKDQFKFITGEDALLEPVYVKGKITLVDTNREKKLDKVDLEETQELDPLNGPSEVETRLDLEALYGKGAGDFDGEFSTVDMDSVAFRRLNKCNVWEDVESQPPPIDTNAAAKFRQKLGKMLAPKVKEIERRRPTMGPKDNGDDNLLWTLIIMFVLLYFIVAGAAMSSGWDYEPNTYKRYPSTNSRPSRMPDYTTGIR